MNPVRQGEDNPTVTFLREIEERILHILSIYPRISPSMLQIGLGSNLPPKMWRPILQDLIDRNLVVQESIVNLSPKGRSQTHIIISMTNTRQKSTEPDPKDSQTQVQE